MHENFRRFADGLHPKFEALVQMEPITDGNLPKVMPLSGIYLFSEGDNHLYVGRTRKLRNRYRQHTRPTSTHLSAPFAFRLARIATGMTKASYAAGENSRAGLIANPIFATAFSESLARVRAMDFRYVEEFDPTAQCLLEVYCSVVLQTPYNDFDTH